MSLLLRTLAEFHRRTLGWAVVAGIFTLGYVRIYSDFTVAIRKTPNMRHLVEVPTTSYLETTVYGLTPPLLVVLCAIGLGARAVAGLEESGELELLLAGPIDRRRLVLTRYAGFALSITVVGLIIWAAVQWFVFIGRLRIDAADVAAACAGIVLLGLFFGSMSFAAGAFTGDRAIALMLAGSLATVAFSLRALAGTAGEARAMRWLSPLDHHLSGAGSHPLRPGSYELLMIALTAALLAVAVHGFHKRDVGTEAA
ncbi:ABC transporter permease subunit [Catenuloplanes sp. NPDC051500]|uniref:ABC transporter permease subunit n=1 Tax=Catenuloplanes sp. NPDC051500 TaxID=3363959 RepID=UPI0037A3FC00